MFFLVPSYLQSERNFIMEVVCEATQSSNTQVKVAALQCLVKIMSLYYQYMELYMAPALFPVSNASISSYVFLSVKIWQNSGISRRLLWRL